MIWSFDIAPKTLAKDLSVSQLQAIEIAKAVSYDARVIIMDEPTSSLTVAETEHLFKIIRRLRRRDDRLSIFRIVWRRFSPLRMKLPSCGMVNISAHGKSETSPSTNSSTKWRLGRRDMQERLSAARTRARGRDIAGRFPSLQRESALVS